MVKTGEVVWFQKGTENKNRETTVGMLNQHSHNNFSLKHCAKTDWVIRSDQLINEPCRICNQMNFLQQIQKQNLYTSASSRAKLFFRCGRDTSEGMKWIKMAHLVLTGRLIQAVILSLCCQIIWTPTAMLNPSSRRQWHAGKPG